MSKPEPEQQGLMRILISKLELAIESFGKGGIAEYVALFDKPGRLLWLNFLAGLVRGFGMAVGFTLIGAAFLIFLGRLAALNLPVIGEFVADVARMVQSELRIR
ncbi:MAG: DUF5665 domain-containing protein [Limnochordia bacterium]